MPVLDPGRRRTRICQFWAHAMDDRPWGGPSPPAVAYVFTDGRGTDSAIDAVSAQRAALGAVQNRLEYSLENVGIYQENLVAAESRIRDVDMAAETVELTKNQILAQAGTAMLAQANQAGQGVLSLLR